MLIFATKKLSTGASGHKEDAASFFCPRSFGYQRLPVLVTYNRDVTSLVVCELESESD